jgi:hypothetical protein
MNWSVDDWKNVLFSDESKMNLYESDGRAYCWRKRGAAIQDHHAIPTVKGGGGSIMIWGCFNADGPGQLCLIEGKMNAEYYQNILGSHLIASVEKLGMDRNTFIFQQDNDPKHTAKSTTKWFSDHNINVLKWPSQSPDLNPIEHFWWFVKYQLRKGGIQFRRKDELWAKVQQIWESTGKDFCMHLIETMPDRMKSVIKANGKYTKY